MRSWARWDREVLQARAADIDDLHHSARTPITARRTWLQAWLDSRPDVALLAIGVEAHDGRLEAIALLAELPGRGPRRLVACGHGPSDALSFPARDAHAAAALAAAVSAELGRTRGPWVLALRQFVPDDQVVPLVGQRLRWARPSQGDVSPALVADQGSSLRTYVSSSHHRGIRRIRNRMVREGLRPEVAHWSAAEGIGRLLPEVERLFRDRDRELGRPCALDVPSERDFFRSTVLRHAERGEVQLTTLHLEGQLAAYVLCFVEGASYRMWNCRFDPAWGRFSAGKLAIDESVEHSLSRGADVYDFMRGSESYKDSYANRRPVAQELWSASGPVGATGVAGYLAARERLRAMEASGGRASAIALRAKAVLTGRGDP